MTTLRVVIRMDEKRGLSEAEEATRRRAVWNVLEGEIPRLVLVNPQHVKALAGRKRYRIDSQRLARYLENGDLQGSFVPPRDPRAAGSHPLAGAPAAGSQSGEESHRTNVRSRQHQSIEPWPAICSVRLAGVCYRQWPKESAMPAAESCVIYAATGSLLTDVACVYMRLSTCLRKSSAVSNSWTARKSMSPRTGGPVQITRKPRARAKPAIIASSTALLSPFPKITTSTSHA